MKLLVAAKGRNLQIKIFSKFIPVIRWGCQSTRFVCVCVADNSLIFSKCVSVCVCGSVS